VSELAFEGQRPPFAPGNELSTRHGAYSPRKVEPLAEEIRAAHVDADSDLAYLREPKYAAAVWAWARAEARVQLVAEYVDRLGVEAAMTAKAGTTSALELLRMQEQSAATHRARLGLDPLSRARLGKDVTAVEIGQAALDRLAERGREALGDDDGTS